MNRGWIVAGVLAFVAAPAVPAVAAGVAMVLERVDDPAGMLRWIRTGDVLRYEVRLNGMGSDARLAVAATPVSSLTGLSCAHVRPSDTPDRGGVEITARALASRALAAPEGTVPGASACRLGDLTSERAVRLEVSVPSGAEEVEVAAVARMREDDGDLTTVTGTARAEVVADPPSGERTLRGPAVRIPEEMRAPARRPYDDEDDESGGEPARVRADELRAERGEPGGVESSRRREFAEAESRREFGGAESGGREAAEGARREFTGAESDGRREAGGVEQGRRELDRRAPAADTGELTRNREAGAPEGVTQQKEKEGHRVEAREPGAFSERRQDDRTVTQLKQDDRAVTQLKQDDRTAAQRSQDNRAATHRGQDDQPAAQRNRDDRAATQRSQGDQAATQPRQDDRAATPSDGGGTAQAQPWSAPQVPQPGLEFPKTTEGEPGQEQRVEVPEVAPPPSAEGAPGAPLPRVVEGADMRVRAEERINPLAGAGGLPYAAGGIGVLLAGLWGVAAAQRRRLRRKVF